MTKNNKIKIIKKILSKITDIELLDLSNPKTYYVYTDVEHHGCFESESFFATKKEVNKFIDGLFTGSSEWDNLIIINTNKNKIIKPHI